MNSSPRNLRWYTKKAARKAMVLGSWGADGIRFLRSGADCQQIRVLTYHRFGRVDYDPFRVDTEVFAEQMRTLAESGVAVSLAEVESFLEGRRSLPEGAVLVTVDDGFRSFYTDAVPVLRDYAIPSVAYVPAGCVDESDNSANEPEPRMPWSEIERLERSGVTVGSHAWSHHSLGTMTAEQVYDEARNSRELLERRTGTSITSFAYPFGTRADYSDDTRRILRECGYKTAFTSQHGAVTPSDDPLELPRIKVEGGEPLWMFRMLVRGGLDRWRWVDRTLWRLQANRERA